MPRYRLLQARRADDPVRSEERASFATKLSVDLDQIEPYDLLAGCASAEVVMDGVDAVLVGGSGHYSICDDEPWIRPFIETLGGLADAQFPTFASCFGFQALVVALGGTVEHDEPNAEVGTFELERLPEAATDPIFGQLPERFQAQLGHKDRAVVLPSQAVPLARSVRCPYQAVRVGSCMYATQFHPELDHHENRFRFSRYFDDYAKVFGTVEAQNMLDSFRPSPHADSLLARFQALPWSR